MAAIFTDPLLDEFGQWPLGYAPYGGGDVDELRAIAATVGDGGADAFYDAFTTAADRLAHDAAAAEAAGHFAAARELHLRASSYYAAAYHPLYGSPVDPRLIDAFDKQVVELNSGLSLGPEPSGPTRIPYDDTTLPGYLIPAANAGGGRRPLIIFTNGYDATITDMYFASAVAASRRGYHCLLFDGPGQGEMLYHHGMPMRPDWEHVITQVVDWALRQDIVDAGRIVLSGWSLGGYLAPRGASGEHRLAAVVADPGQWDVGAAMTTMATALGVSADAATHPKTIDAATIAKMMGVITADPRLRWMIVQRGFWVNGVDNLADFLAATLRYTLDDVGRHISCPVLVTSAENDFLSQGADRFTAELGDRVTRVRFTAAEGAGMHCEMLNRPLLNERVLDWLDTTLG
ncbi:MAG: alpha/beta fold hydrolase [Gordonia sp. (in: high G+C Gram-positive bacteria)]|uniref:alpha/beta hydrolase family protein n=1 Tax=Gordonia sp. (in: high G+C Gram-positive bacteria) TaxID=84139 RepID=UPI0039E3663E